MIVKITVESDQPDVGCEVKSSPAGRMWDVVFHAEGHSYLIGQQESLHAAIGLAISEVV